MGALVPTANGKRKEGPGKAGREHDVAQTWNFPAGWKFSPPVQPGLLERRWCSLGCLGTLVSLEEGKGAQIQLPSQ